MGRRRKDRPLICYLSMAEQPAVDDVVVEPSPRIVERAIEPATPPPPPQPAAPRPEVPKGHADVGPGSYPSRGGEVDPEVTIVVFSDFECVYCQTMVGSLTEVDASYGDRVAIHFRDHPLDVHPDAYGAHEAARCASAQGRFWAKHDLLFANRGQLQRERLFGYARLLDLDEPDFTRCMRAGETRLVIEIDREAGREAGVKRVPAFFVNGAFYQGGSSVERLTGLIEAALVEGEVPP